MVIKSESPIWRYCQQYVLPTIFVTTFPFLGIVMALYPLENGLSRFHLGLLFGNKFSWCFLTALISWALLFLKVPSKKFRGPASPSRYVPVYSANGFTYYCYSVAGFSVLNVLFPTLSEQIYDNMPHILGNLTLVAMILCAYLWFSGKYHPNSVEKQESLPLIFEFYRGMELHPRIFGVDVKQLTNCRIGLIMWQLLVLAFWFTSLRRIGLNYGMCVNALLQSVYLAKFYWWETGYFNTLDITLDRAGFYICWGCLSFVPSCYTYSSYYLASHPPTIGGAVSAVFFVLGLVSIWINYQIDHEKERFRNTDGRCTIWGRNPKTIEAKYKTRDNKTKSTQLLVSGSWGIARHINYVFELLLALFWNLPGYSSGILTFYYNIVLTILLIHRIYRDEDKCRKKYSTYWEKYCQAVPYRMIPYIY